MAISVLEGNRAEEGRTKEETQRKKKRKKWKKGRTKEDSAVSGQIMSRKGESPDTASTGKKRSHNHIGHGSDQKKC